MAVEVRYLVIRDGKEVGMYLTKKEADEYDKMLDIAVELSSFIGEAEQVKIDEDSLEALTLYLSQHREEVIRILKALKPRKQAPDEPKEQPKTVPLPIKGKKAGRGK